jgi:hypothetical protein
LKHDVLHAEFGIAAHCRRDCLYRPCQGIVEEGALDVFASIETTAAHVRRALQVQRLLSPRSQRTVD